MRWGSRSASCWSWWLIFVVAVTALWGVVVLVAPLAPDALTWTSNIGQTAAALTASAVCVWRGKESTGAVRRFWLAIGAGCLGWAVGQAIWTYYESVSGQEPFPSLADAGYLAFPPFVVLAMFLLPSVDKGAAARARTLLDGMIIAGSFLLCSWLLVLEPVYRAHAGNALDVSVSVAYPASDTVILTMVTYTVVRSRVAPAAAQVPMLLVAFGLVSFALSDVAFAFQTTTQSYSTGRVTDLGWVAGFALLAVAAGRPGPQSEPQRSRSLQPVSDIVPNAAAGLALLACSIDLFRTGVADPLVIWIGSAVVGLLIVRQSLTLRENHSLTRHLEQRVAARTGELQASKARFAAMVAHSSDVVTVLDESGVIAYHSDSSARVLGHDPRLWVGRHVVQLVDGRAEGATFQEAFHYTAAEPGRIHTVLSHWRLESGRCDVEVTFTNLLDNPDVRGVILNTRNITERKVLEDQLVHQAFHDPLTSLANRALFRDRLEHAMTRRDTRDVSVLYTDLDGFKTVNDTRGHGSGDVILCQVAARLTSQVRPSDTVARIGGDEFAVLVDDVAESTYLQSLAERISVALREPFHLDGQEIHLAGSIGIAELTPDVLNAEQLLRNADLAMYQAKSRGEGGFAFYAHAMHTDLVAQMKLESDLRAALDTESFAVYYQPLVSLHTGAITGVEALLRWHHAERGFIEPREFIPAAESTGLIRPLGLWALRQACLQMSAWQRDLTGAADLQVNVNLSGRQLQQPDLAAQIARILVDTGLSARSLTLEMTESVLMDDSEDTLRTLSSIRDLGVRLAIDDFGTGYSSLSYLHQFPVNTLKIDSSFIEGLSLGGDAALVKGILHLAQSLGIESVAEGITRGEDAQLLREFGCITGQGYYYSRPVPAELMTSILEADLGAGSGLPLGGVPGLDGLGDQPVAHVVRDER